MENLKKPMWAWSTGDRTLSARAPSSEDWACSLFAVCEGNGSGAIGYMAPPMKAGNVETSC
jgi:hypothetical protein